MTAITAILLTIILILVLGLAIAKTMIGHRNETIKNLDGNVSALEVDKVLLRNDIMALRQGASRAAVESFEANKALQTKLEDMHLATMRFCEYTKDIYYAASDADLERWQHPMLAGSKPTVDEWIAMANGISAFAEVNKKQWWDRVHARDARSLASYKLGCQFLQNILNPHESTISGPCGGDGGAALDKDLDLRLLRFLEGLRKLIELDHQDGGISWTAQRVEKMMSETSFQGRFLRRKLVDLVTHHNQEYMTIIDRLPPDIAQYFLRLTVAEQPATKG